MSVNLTGTELRKDLLDITRIVIESDLGAAMKSSVIADYVLWKWTASLRNETKFRGCRYWSKRALDQWGKTGKADGLRHDHVVPRSVLAKILLEGGTEKLGQMLDRLGRACVLTKEEDDQFVRYYKVSLMPAKWRQTDTIWARYERCFRQKGIKILEIEWGNDEHKVLRTEFEIVGSGPPPCQRAKIEGLGAIKKEFPPKCNLQLFQLEERATFLCSHRKTQTPSTKVALNLNTGDLLCNSAYEELLAEERRGYGVNGGE